MQISLPGTTEPAWYKFVKEYLVGKEQERTILYYFKHSAIIYQHRCSNKQLLNEVE